MTHGHHSITFSAASRGANSSERVTSPKQKLRNNEKRQRKIKIKCFALLFPFSLALHNPPSSSKRSNSSTLTPLERSELSRRRSQLFLYLLRSPFYDAVTKKILLAFLVSVRNNVPLGGKIADIAMVYVPHYRNIYGYLWSK